MTESDFAELVRKHGDAIRAFIFRRGSGLDNGVSDVDDIAADVWATAWSRQSQAPEAGNDDANHAWLFQISRLVLANHIRKTVTRRKFGVTDAELTSASVDHIVIHNEDIRRGFDALTPGEKEVFALTVWEGLKPAEIAQVLNISPNAASLRLFKARTKISEILAERN